MQKHRESRRHLVHVLCGTLNVLELPHLQKRHQEGQRGLRSLVFVGPIGMKTIATAAGAGVVQGGFQIVISQKPIERRPSLGVPTFISGGAIGFQACRDCRTCFQRLLIEPSFFARFAIEALRADRYKVSVHGAALLFLKPFQRLQAGREPFLVRCARARQQSGPATTGHWNMPGLFKPVPARRAGGLVDVQQLAGENVPLPLCSPVPGKAIKIFLDSE